VGEDLGTELGKLLEAKISVRRIIDRGSGITMKQLPDENTLQFLLELAQDAEQKAKTLCDLTTEIDEKWRIRLESRRKIASKKSNSSQD
jgi:hypothetical protein